MNDFVEEALCTRLFDVAERVRWRMDDIPWERLDDARITPRLRTLVREIAASELTTTTATRRFLADLGDDADFTQWLAVWFYEESKHPQVLLRWLRRAGVAVDDGFVLRGRATAPLMRSRIGTLVSNVISEMVAWAAYATMYACAEEPVLTVIARNLAADEARHAACFYEYARRHLERSREVDADRRDAVKVLYLWFHQNAQVRHPVSEHYARIDAIAPAAFERIAPRERISRAIGALVDLPLTADTDLRAVLGELKGDAP